MNKKLKSMFDAGSMSGMGRTEAGVVAGILREYGSKFSSQFESMAGSVHPRDVIPPESVASFARAMEADDLDPAHYGGFVGKAPTTIESIARRDDSGMVLMMGDGGHLYKGWDIRTDAGRAAKAKHDAERGVSAPAGTAAGSKTGFYDREIETLIARGSVHGWDSRDRTEIKNCLDVDAPQHSGLLDTICASVKENQSLGAEQVKVFAKKIGREYHPAPVPDPKPAQAKTEPDPAPTPAPAATFPELVQASVAAGMNETDAVAFHAKENKAAHRAWLEAGAGSLKAKSNGQAAQKPTEPAEPDFVGIVRGLRAKGHAKSVAVSMAIASHPAEHRAWLMAGGSQL